MLLRLCPSLSVQSSFSLTGPLTHIRAGVKFSPRLFCLEAQLHGSRHEGNTQVCPKDLGLDLPKPITGRNEFRAGGWDRVSRPVRGTGGSEARPPRNRATRVRRVADTETGKAGHR